jgi:PAS domain S-box-containing protein
LREVIECLPEAIVVTDSADKLILWNNNYASMFPAVADILEPGIKYETVVRKDMENGNYSEAVGEESEETWLAGRLQDHSQAGTTTDLKLNDGRWIRFDQHKTPDGKKVGVRTDITDIKNAAESFRLLFDNNPVPMFVFDQVSFAYLDVNNAAIAHYGYSREQFLSMSLIDIRPARDRQKFLDHVVTQAMISNGELDWTHVKADGTEITINSYAKPIKYYGVNAALSTAIDVTERRKTETALRESEARHRFLDSLSKETAKSTDAAEILEVTTRMLGEHLGVAICAYADMEPDQNHFTIRGDWSMEGSSSIVGYYSLADFGKIAVRKLRAGLPLIVNDNSIELAPKEAATFQSMGIAATTCMPLVKQGRLTALVAIHDRIPRIWRLSELAILSEVTERSWAHIERVRSEAEVRKGAHLLVQAQKMEAIGNLTGGIAHDFNNLLGIVIGNLDQLRGQKIGGILLNPKIDQLASEALDAALRGAELTKHLLAFARRQSLSPQQIDVNELVQETNTLLSRILGNDIEIKLNLLADTWPVDADPSQLVASLINIANNARDAMPKGGVLTITTGNRHLDEDYATLHPELVPGNYALIEVSDTGTGIAPEILNQIFEPFFTTKEQGKGTGLGLSMVFGFVKQSAGHISVYSEEGHGTTFRLYLPRATASTSAPETVFASERGGHETVLAVEDNISLRRIAVHQLNDLGYRVFEAEDGNAALKILESEPVDLLFTDIMMPGGMSGYDLALKATARWPALKVILTSGFPEAKLNGNGVPPAGLKLLTKPYRKLDLAQVLRQLLDVNDGAA